MREKTLHSSGLKKFFKYLGLGSLTALLTVVLALGNYSSVVGVTEVKAATSDSSTVQVSTPSASQLVQEGQQRYQSGEFAAAVKLWQQAANAFSTQGDNPSGSPSDRINQAMVLSNLALAYHQLGQWTEANQAITTSLQLLQTEKSGSDRKTELDRVLRLKTLAQALNTLINPTQGLTELPTQLVDSSSQINRECAATGDNPNKFTVTGRGGLPQSPTDVISPDMVQDDFGTLEASNRPSSQPTPQSVKPTPTNPPQQLVEAQGWVVDNIGVVTLVAAAPTVTPHSPALTPASCQESLGQEGAAFLDK